MFPTIKNYNLLNLCSRTSLLSSASSSILLNLFVLLICEYSVSASDSSTTQSANPAVECGDLHTNGTRTKIWD